MDDPHAHELVEQFSYLRITLHDVFIKLSTRLTGDAPKDDQQRLLRFLFPRYSTRQVVVDPVAFPLDSLSVATNFEFTFLRVANRHRQQQLKKPRRSQLRPTGQKRIQKLWRDGFGCDYKTSPS